MTTEQVSQPATALSRRQRAQGERRDRYIKATLSAEEYDAVVVAAAQAGLTPAAFMAESALSVAGLAKPPTGSARQDLQSLGRALEAAYRELNRVGTNLNQAVAALNKSGKEPESLARFAASVGEHSQRVDDVIGLVQSRLNRRGGLG